MVAPTFTSSPHAHAHVSLCKSRLLKHLFFWCLHLLKSHFTIVKIQFTSMPPPTRPHYKALLSLAKTDSSNAFLKDLSDEHLRRAIDTLWSEVDISCENQWYIISAIFDLASLETDDFFMRFGLHSLVFGWENPYARGVFINELNGQTIDCLMKMACDLGLS